ncbi:MAG: hypothetical protein CL868_13605 [Cytophagaceae bacterium]|nr:hypothetical protein [Cytophagaceae bacterium]|tara:strand:+ start:2364 stop:3125 length:762 start_codon:yes stop_codon:yes gene_type:complete
MAPIKFEENIKRKLDERKINPSASAWAKIEGQLQGQEHGAKKYPWLWMAASIAALLVIATLFFSRQRETPAIQEPQLVETQVKQPQVKKENVLVPMESKTQVADNETTDMQKTTEPVINQVISPQRVEKLNIEKQEETTIAENPPLEEEINKLKSPAFENEVNTKVREVIASVEHLEKRGAAVSDAEIDSLLKAAQQDIVREHMFIDNDRRVSATALLEEVEQELDPSFRDRVFEALKNGFNQAREALATRNN